MHIDIRLFLYLGKYIYPIAVIGFLMMTPSHVRAELSIEDGPQIGAIAEQLADADTTVRAEGIRLLKEYGQSAMPFLIGIREYGSPDQRRGAVLGLALLPIPALATDELIAALADEDLTTRSMAAHALAVVGPTAAPRLTAELSSQDIPVRSAAAYALKLMGTHAIPALTTALGSEDALVISHAAGLLGHMGRDALAAVPALIRALDADDIRVMHVVAETLDLIGPEPALVRHHLLLLNSKPDGFPFGRIGRGAAPTLVRLLTRPGTPMGQIAFRTLASIGHDATPALMAALDVGTPGQRIAAALLLVDIDPNMAQIIPEDLRSALAGVTNQPEQ